ncbi:MAG: alpha/beta hydrolase family protein [Elusimicrobiales bacterium]
MTIIYILATALVIWYLLYQSCKNSIINFLSNPKRGFTKTPEDLRLPYETVFLDTSDGVEISGWFIESRKPSNLAFIIIGDAFNTKSDLLEQTIFLLEEFNLLYLDPRGVGTSKGRYRFGFDEHRDIEAAYSFLKNVKDMGKIYIYTVGFGFVSLFFIGDDVDLKGAVVKKPSQKPLQDIERMIKSKAKVMICGSAIDSFFGTDISRFSFESEKIKFPVVFITDRKITYPSSICVKTDEELKKVLFNFFRC